MKVRCIANTGAALSEKHGGVNKNCEFCLEIGRVYTVYSILLSGDTLDYLISGYGRPDWMPAELFEVVDSTFPPEWHFSFRGYEAFCHDDVWGYQYLTSAIWGYKEMALDPNHIVKLFEREDIDIFLERQKEIDERLELKKITEELVLIFNDTRYELQEDSDDELVVLATFLADDAAFRPSGYYQAWANSHTEEESGGNRSSLLKIGRKILIRDRQTGCFNTEWEKWFVMKNERFIELLDRWEQLRKSGNPPVKIIKIGSNINLELK